MYTLTVQTDVAYYLSWELEYKDSDPRFQVCVCVCGGGGGGGNIITTRGYLSECAWI